MAEIPETDARYQLRLDALMDLHAYADGTYTLFPQKKQELSVPDARQMSLTDLFELNVPEEAMTSEAVVTEEGADSDRTENEETDLQSSGTEEAGNKQEPAAASADNPPGWAEQEICHRSL